MEIPETIGRAILLCTPLSLLEAAGLLQSATPSLPNVACVLNALRGHLITNPRQFWENPNFGFSLHERVWMTHAKFDWRELDGANVAFAPAIDDAFLDALAGVLLRIRGINLQDQLAKTAEGTQDRPVKSLFSRLRPRKQGRQSVEVRLEFGREDARSAIFFHPHRCRSLRDDYDFLVEETQRYGVPFNLTFEEFGTSVRLEIESERRKFALVSGKKMSSTKRKGSKNDRA